MTRCVCCYREIGLHENSFFYGDGVACYRCCSRPMLPPASDVAEKSDYRERCHVCGKPSATGVLTICEPDREDADAMACCESCARNRRPVQFAGVSHRRDGKVMAESASPDRAGRLSAVDLVDEVAARFADLRKWLDSNLPDGRGKAVALTQLDTARLWALSVAGEVKP